MSTTAENDLDACAREPIHIPGAVQPHGALLVLAPDTLAVLQASANAASLLGEAPRGDEPLGGQAGALNDRLREWLATGEPSYQDALSIDGRDLQVAAHICEDGLIVECESISGDGEASMDRLFPKLRTFAETVPKSEGTRGLAALAARFVREIAGFDRVLVYRFDPEWNGHVVGEDGNGNLPSYLDLRFPAGDIPPQARELYKLNRLRMIPTADYEPVPIEPAANPRTGKPTDLSLAGLRSVSPIHLEYMRNMGTAASMSISILVDGELWGLVACHSREPHGVSLNVRSACDFAVQALAMEIGARARAAEASVRAGLGDIQSRLLAAMSAESDWTQGLANNPEDFLAQVNASGAAVVFEEECRLAGKTPDETRVRALVAALEERDETEVFHSDNLSADLPEAADCMAVASGLLAVRISELYPAWVLWFRPEVIETVEWGGDPHKYVREAGRIHPRRSFAAWKEQVRGRAHAWQSAEIAAALSLRGSIVGIVLRRAEELAALSEELQRSNKELEAFSYSVSHDLRAPFRHIMGFAQLLRERADGLDEKSRHYLETISDSAIAAGRLVDDLLNFSHVGRTAIRPASVNMDKLVGEVRQSLKMEAGDRGITWTVDPLPLAWADSTLIRQVVHNLVGNAVKYTERNEHAEIRITGWEEDGRTVYRVSDNGVGFDMTYLEKLFGVFQRLQRAEDFEGTGIGLALARRIVDRHGGRIWAEGKVGEGATFTFALPKGKTETDDG